MLIVAVDTTTMTAKLSFSSAMSGQGSLLLIASVPSSSSSAAATALVPTTTITSADYCFDMNATSWVQQPTTGELLFGLSGNISVSDNGFAYSGALTSSSQSSDQFSFAIEFTQSKNMEGQLSVLKERENASSRCDDTRYDWQN